MINILLTGVGGQGTVLAAKLLAQAASSKGWQVRTAETIGMAQRGGSVISHVRIGNDGEEVLAPLITLGTADMIIAFEPTEAARTLGYLAPCGTVVTATSVVQPVTASLASSNYNAEDTIAGIRAAISKTKAHFQQTHPVKVQQTLQQAQTTAQLIAVDDTAITNKLGGNRKILNSVLLAVALIQNKIPLTIDDLCQAIKTCVKPKFVDMNLEAIEAAIESLADTYL